MMIRLIGRNVLFVALVLILQSIVLVLSAKVIECSIVQISAGPDLVLLSVIVSMASVVYFAVSKSGDVKLTFITAVLYFLLIIVSAILKNGFHGNESHYVKLLICIICGEIIGVFFGSHRQNRLRKSPKRRSLTTK